MVPEFGPPGGEEGFIAIDVEEWGNGGGVDVGCEGVCGPGWGWGFFAVQICVCGLAGQGVKGWRVGEED